VIHSESDREPVERRYRLDGRPCVVIPHGPNDHHASNTSSTEPLPRVRRAAPPGVTNLLFFGIIRPYKGLEDLVEAFNALDPNEAENYWLTVVGETWEGWELPIRLIERSRYRERITLVNRFVSDAEVVAHFASADAVVLPYHRSSASSPASVTMSNGLPLVITAVGGLPAAVANYEGAVLVPPHDPKSLREAIRTLPALHGRRYADPHSWQRTVINYQALLDTLDGRYPGSGGN
jgi:glycosyltransferase involved in cell wall biosynthesis